MSGTKITILSEAVLRRVLTMTEAIEVNRQAFIALAKQQATVPTRLIIPHKDLEGATLFKPAHVDTPDLRGLGLKLVGVRPHNAPRGHPTVPGLVVLVDDITCLPAALMDTTYLTALRTAAGSGAATALLARPDASRLVIFGAGAQGKAHLEAMCLVRKISHVTVWNRTAARAHELVKEAKEHPNPAISELIYVVAEDDAQISQAVRQAHIIVAATNSSTPVFKGEDLQEGTHINAIGAYQPTMQELDPEMVKRSLTVTDNPPAEIFAGTGDYGIPLKAGTIQEGCIVGRLGDALAGHIQVRRSDRDITIFKSVGNAVQDIATAAAALKRAKALGLGQECDL